MNGAKRYMDAIRARLDAIAESQTDAIDVAAQAVVASVQAGGTIFTFGTGHSHMLAEEGHYRAGGLAAVCPILSTALMLHEGSVLSGALERTAGVGPAIFQQYNPRPDDILFVFSNSGVNMAPVETAMAAKDLGMQVIAIVALDYAANISPGPTGKKLADIADIVLDNLGPPGDALVDVGDSGLRTGPHSTIAGAFILNAILTEVACTLSELDATPPIYISANMPGASAHNAALVAAFRSKNPHL